VEIIILADIAKEKEKSDDSILSLQCKLQFALPSPHKLKYAFQL